MSFLELSDFKAKDYASDKENNRAIGMFQGPVNFDYWKKAGCVSVCGCVRGCAEHGIGVEQETLAGYSLSFVAGECLPLN